MEVGISDKNVGGCFHRTESVWCRASHSLRFLRATVDAAAAEE